MLSIVGSVTLRAIASSASKVFARRPKREERPGSSAEGRLCGHFRHVLNGISSTSEASNLVRQHYPLPTTHYLLFTIHYPPIEVILAKISPACSSRWVSWPVLCFPFTNSVIRAARSSRPIPERSNGRSSRPLVE